MHNTLQLSQTTVTRAHEICMYGVTIVKTNLGFNKGVDWSNNSCKLGMDIYIYIYIENTIMQKFLYNKPRSLINALMT